MSQNSDTFLDKLLCIHRHDIDSHPGCFLNGLVKDNVAKKYSLVTGKPWYTYPGYKIGYFDIEVDNLRADYGTMLTWTVKEKDGEIFTGKITQKELFTGETDKRIVKELIEKLKEFSIIVGYYSCVTPGHRVLKADLTWVNVEDLVPGDKLLSVTEEIPEESRTYEYRQAEVVHNIPIIEEVFEITLEDETVLKATGNHPWLVQRHNTWVWRTTKELLHFNCDVPTMQRVFSVWEPDVSYEAGYLAGFFDSEGGIYQAPRKDRDGKYNIQLYASQHSVKNSEILDRVTLYLNKFGLEFSVKPYDNDQPDMRSVCITGGKRNIIEFLGKLRLAKASNLDINKLGSIKSDNHLDSVKIVSIKSLGEQVVCGLGTTEKTYITEGFISHNTGFDIPYIRTRAVIQGIDFPPYGQPYHFDLYYTVRNKFALSRNGLGRAVEVLVQEDSKTHCGYETWARAKYGDPVALDEILEYNIQDVIVTEKLHNKIASFAAWQRRSI
jgi:DNA polymerase elongation subunit (family B)